MTTYTPKQIENAKIRYTLFLQNQTPQEQSCSHHDWQEAERRAYDHNELVSKIKAGDKKLAKKWKLFFLNDEVKLDRKEAASKAKLAANKAASADVLEPVKSAKKLVAFGKWLNTPGNKFRKQHFNKKYTTEAVESFMATV